MSDKPPSVTLEGPRAAWMPVCPQCGREVDGLVRWDDYDGRANVYEAQCHGERDELRIPISELADVPWRDVESYIRNRIQRWQPFGN